MAKIIQRPNSIEHIMEIKEVMEGAPYIVRAQEDVVRRLLFVSWMWGNEGGG